MRPLLSLSLTLLAALLSPAFTLAQPVPPLSRLLLNSSGTFAASSGFSFAPLLDFGWSRASLCGDSLDDCGLQVILQQRSPSFASCALHAIVQVACESQTTPSFATSQVCVTPAAAGAGAVTNDVLFPQDSPNIAAGDVGSTDMSLSVSISPWMLRAAEEVATRNAASAVAGGDAAGASTLALRLALVSPSASCAGSFSYSYSLRVVHSAYCDSFAIVPDSTIIVPGVNGTNSTVVVPGWNVSTPVPCSGLGASCSSAWSSDSGGNYTSTCLCDLGWTLRSDGVCIESPATDLTIAPSNGARPPAPVYPNGTDPSSGWIHANNQSTRGTVETLSLQLSPTAPGVTPLGKGGVWSARTNLSRELADLSLVLHVTPIGALPASTQLALFLSDRFYPSPDLHMSLACLNSSDLLVAGDGGSGSRWRNGAGPSGTSCAPLTSGWPQTDLPTTATPAFRVMLHPPFVAGFLNRSSAVGAYSASGASSTLYLSLWFSAPVNVELRSWWQGDVDAWVPRALPPPPPPKKDASESIGARMLSHASRTLARVWPWQSSAVDTPTAPTSTALALSSSSTSPRPDRSVSLPPAYIPWPTQSWVGSLRAAESVFVHLDTRGAGPELASLYLMVNDTRCVGGAATQGWVAPHWWGSSDRSADLKYGMSPGGLPAITPPPMSEARLLDGACWRPTERWWASDTPAALSGVYAQLDSVCDAAVELLILHVPPLDLPMTSLGVMIPATLNRTGSGCWREMKLELTTSIQNDLLVTVDQSDAVILLAQGELPTPNQFYNETKQTAIDPLDQDGSRTKWSQHSIAYADLSHGASWFVGVYFTAQSGDPSRDARHFRVQLQWKQNPSFMHHMSKTVIIIVATIGSVVGLLILLAIKLRIDACRRERAANRKDNKRLSLRQPVPSYSRMS